MTAPLPYLPARPAWPKLGDWTDSDIETIEAYARLAVREALERAAHNAELVQLRMKLPDQPHVCLYAENIASAIRDMQEDYK